MVELSLEKELEKKKEFLIKELIEQGITDELVLDAIRNVPRHLFVPSEFLDEAYANYPLPIGYGQTISQPYTVAFMLQELGLRKGLKVFEVGTGSGWNAGLIAWIVKPALVYTTEIIAELAEMAKRNLKSAGIKNVKVLPIDGSCGYAKEAPYDRIIVTAACPSVPKMLVEQLRIGGELIAPVGGCAEQKMVKVIKRKNRLEKKELGYFVFVPLRGKYGTTL